MLRLNDIEKELIRQLDHLIQDLEKYKKKRDPVPLFFNKQLTQQKIAVTNVFLNQINKLAQDKTLSAIALISRAIHAFKTLCTINKGGKLGKILQRYHSAINNIEENLIQYSNYYEKQLSDEVKRMQLDRDLNAYVLSEHKLIERQHIRRLHDNLKSMEKDFLKEKLKQGEEEFKRLGESNISHNVLDRYQFEKNYLPWLRVSIKSYEFELPATRELYFDTQINIYFDEIDPTLLTIRENFMLVEEKERNRLEELKKRLYDNEKTVGSRKDRCQEEWLTTLRTMLDNLLVEVENTPTLESSKIPTR
ncbi:MAG: hypothetical protein EPO11_08200 [Gammaproteobacteria bacterium]|nr:MAG: hypothetical protein EPO11_08200 [Gammaproteobacteria bacterium]